MIDRINRDFDLISNRQVNSFTGKNNFKEIQDKEALIDKLDIGKTNTTDKENPPAVKHDHEHSDVDTVMEGIHVAGEMADPLGAAGFLGNLAAVGTIATGIYFGIAGVKDMQEAIKNKSAMGMIESTGHLMVAGDAVLAASSLLTSSAAISAVMGPSTVAVLTSPAMAVAGMVFGLGHGAAEVIVGGKELAGGIKSKEKNEVISGLLKMGIGSSIMACVMGAGLPGGIALAVLLVSDIAFRRDSYKRGLIEMHGAVKQSVNKLKNKITPNKKNESYKNKDMDPLDVLKVGQSLNLADFSVKRQ